MALARREFLCRLGSFGAAALAMERFGIMDALAQSTDYKALVCIFLFGGNDANNMVMPYTDYTSYSNARLASGIAIPKANLLQVSPPSLPGTVFGLHPAMTGLQELWTMGKLGVVCNVGPLVEPTSRTTYQNGSARVPLNLFSHSDQQNQWQTSVSNSQSTAGWGGRIADKTADLNIVTFPAITSTRGNADFHQRKCRAASGDCGCADSAQCVAAVERIFGDPVDARRGIRAICAAKSCCRTRTSR